MDNPWPLEADADAFYGNPRGANGSYSPAWAADNLTHVACPWQLHMDAIPIPRITIHKKLAESLTRVLGNTWDKMGKSQDAINKAGFSVFSGSFNFRCIRGSSMISMHSYGGAIDWDAPENPMGFGALKHLFTDATPLIAEFKAEFWRWGGDYSHRVDYMHVEGCH